MRKFPILILTALLLGAYALFLVYWFTPSPAQPDSPVISETAGTTATGDTEDQPPPEISTTESVPLETVMSPDYALTAKLAFVYDCASEQLVFTLGSQTQSISPASLTKLLTVYVALQYLEPDTPVTAGEECTWIDPESSIAHVKPGNRLTVEMLVEGMLLQSGNDAAYTLAAAAGRAIRQDPALKPRAAIDAFMEQINVQAKALGLENTYFVTPDGLDANGHRTTCADMLKLCLTVMEQPLIRHYAGISQAQVKFESGQTHTWRNTNFLLHPTSKYYCPEACGLKTGSTGKAGNCLLASFYTGERYLIVGVFGCPSYEARFADALFLYESYR
ncbi:MAG: D-alanyl-D-alanine carboxypeptidase [Oscillospiraceae bacterium]|nr:D-alanyl-D-alanine carboxypeptidase [Oscillospiraceae bacterium]